MLSSNESWVYYQIGVSKNPLEFAIDQGFVKARNRPDISLRAYVSCGSTQSTKKQTSPNVSTSKLLRRLRKQ